MFYKLPGSIEYLKQKTNSFGALHIVGNSGEDETAERGFSWLLKEAVAKVGFHRSIGKEKHSGSSTKTSVPVLYVPAFFLFTVELAMFMR